MRAMSHAIAVLRFVGVCASDALGAQEPVTLTGLVRDEADRPIAETLVFVDDGTTSALTDRLGVFRLEGVTADARVLSYRKAGFAGRSFGLGPGSAQGSRDVGTVVLLSGPEPRASLVGTVREGIGGQPLTGAVIELNGETVGVTDTLGAFQVPEAPVRWGPNQVIVRHLSFVETTATDEFWITNAGTTVDFSVSLDVAPLGLPGVEVSGRSIVLEASGFYGRRENVNGVFMTHDEIIARDPRRVTDLFDGLGGGFNRSPGTFGRADDGQDCHVVIFLDGLIMTSAQDLDELVRPEMLEGIEVYRSIAGLPARFSPIGATCGVVIMWTR